jgi:hypothetical protein
VLGIGPAVEVGFRVFKVPARSASGRHARDTP